jgi:hypothetical protein
MWPSQCQIKFYYNAALPTSYKNNNSDDMHYLYQDERALPGNLQSRRYSFVPPKMQCLSLLPLFSSLCTFKSTRHWAPLERRFPEAKRTNVRQGEEVSLSTCSNCKLPELHVSLKRNTQHTARCRQLSAPSPSFCKYKQVFLKRSTSGFE